MSGVALNIRSDELQKLQADVAELSDAAATDDMRLVIGRAAQQVVKGHFEALSRDDAHHRTANRLGAERTGFYEEAADFVQAPELESEGVSISMTGPRGLAQRFFGGTIDMGEGWLTLPARTEVYGKRARERNDLFFVLFNEGETAGLLQKDTGLLFYHLVHSVTQEPDPTVLPDEDAIVEPAMQEAGAYLEQLWARLPAMNTSA